MDWHEPDWPPRRRYQRRARQATTEDLETRLEELREEIRRVEAELMEVRGADEAVADTT